MTDGLILYVPGSVMILALLIKAPTLRRGWDQPLMRAVCTLLVVGCLVMFLAAPPTIAAVNRLTGIVNFSAPLVYGVLTAFSGSCIVLVLQWGGGPPAVVRRATRLTVAAFSAVTLLIVVLFAIGDAPVERLRDLDTYYANTPWLREMIVCYLLAHTVGSSTLTLLCWKWLLRVRPSLRPLRTGLALIVLGGALDLGYLISKWTAVGARWTGRDWDGLSTYVAPPFASAAALMVGSGFIVPLVGGSAAWRDFSQYRRLHPLWKALRGFAASSVTTVPLTWWSPIGIRLIHRESVIDDGILALGRWFDPSVRGAAYEAALRQGLPEPQASVVADAAMLAAACRRREAAEKAEAADRAGADGDGQHPAGADQGLPEPYRLDSRPLAALAREFRTSPIVATARRDPALP
ncbi:MULTISPECIES: MAB_1171c family putative transporter [unclassified Streptomyces]|uniref:MAB_1171c family putative transporter n=1 Tax=unclassified Streptomyces TaxID=2593676 RepID=UPI002E366096|nr:MAB_1171c family putative transporter [Streptomyces sp. NBC_01278]